MSEVSESLSSDNAHPVDADVNVATLPPAPDTNGSLPTPPTTNATTTTTTAAPSKDSFADLSADVISRSKSSANSHDELASAQARITSLLSKQDEIQSELLVYKKRYDMTVDALTAQKDDEIRALTDQFAAVQEKRKKLFLDLKEKYQQATALVASYQSQNAADAAAISERDSTISSLRSQTSLLQAEVDAMKSGLSSSTADLTKRIADLEMSILSEQNASAAAKQSLTEAQNELASAKAKIESLDEKQRRILSAKCSITADELPPDAQQPPTTAGILETGRTVTFKWSLPGDVRLQWFRSFRGGSWEAIPGKAATRPKYTVGVDDIGASLKAEATPTSAGVQVFAECGPVYASTSLLIALAEAIRKFDVLFNVEVVEREGAATGGDRKRQIALNKEKLKLRSGGKTTAKAVWSDAVRVTVDGDSSTKFFLVMEQNGPQLHFTSQSPRERDYFVETIRLFNLAIVHPTQFVVKQNPATEHILSLSLTLAQLNTLSKTGPIRTTSIQKKTGSTPSATTAPKDKGPTTPSATASVGGNATPKAPKGGASPAKPTSNTAASTTPNSKAKGATTGAATPSSAGKSASKPGAPGTPTTPALEGSKNGDDDGGWGAFALSASAPTGTDAVRKGSVSSNAPSQSATATVLSPPAAPKVVRRNADGDEIDEEGFIVAKQRGFDDYGAKADESDDDFADDAESKAPAIKVNINAEARPAASGDALKAMTAGLSLNTKVGKKKGKEKKSKKKSADGAANDDINALMSPTAAAINATAGAVTLAAASNGSSDPFADLFGGSSSSPPPPPHTGNAADLLDSLFPMTKSSAPDPVVSLDEFITVGSTSATSVKINVAVVETINARFVDGTLTEYAVMGEVILTAERELSESAQFDFTLNAASDKMRRVIPTAPHTAATATPNSFTVNFPLATTTVSAVKYQLNTDNTRGRAEIPLTANIEWKCDDSKTNIVVRYGLNGDFALPTNSRVTDLRFLIALTPANTVTACASAQPPCLFSASSQKLMWTVTAFPPPNEPTTRQATLNAELSNTSRVTKSPLAINFNIDNAPQQHQHVNIKHVHSNAANKKIALAMGAMTYKIKAGVFQRKLKTVLVKMLSTAATGFFYLYRKNPTRITRKLAFRKFDPRVRRHVVFEETKMK